MEMRDFLFFMAGGILGIFIHHYLACGGPT